MSRFYDVLIAAVISTTTFLSPAKAQPVSPPIVQADHATPPIKNFFKSYFIEKTSHDANGLLGFFSPNMATYSDAVLGYEWPSFVAFKDFLVPYMATLPPAAVSYPIRIVGGPESAIVEFVDTPEWFGSKIPATGVVDIRDGKIVRWIDYWDASTFDTNLYNKLRTPSDKFPTDFKENAVGEMASEKIRNVAQQLADAFRNDDARSAASLFSNDAIYEDRALRSEIVGRSAIEGYLTRILPDAPFGVGSQLRHIVGGDLGGGFEWRAGPSSALKVGVTTLELDNTGHISRLTTVYDSRQLPKDLVLKLVDLSREP